MVSQSSYLRCALVGLSPAENMWPESCSGSGPLWVNRFAPAHIRDLSAYPSIAVEMWWCAKRGDVPGAVFGAVAARHSATAVGDRSRAARIGENP